MSAVVITPTALRNIERLIELLNLPADTQERVGRSIQFVAQFPLIGSPLHGRWAGFRYVLGPWRWMIVVYAFDEPSDRVLVVTIQDTRAPRAATGER